MKIALDARFLTHPQSGGFKTYTKNLVNALSQVDCYNQYVIYLDRPPTLESLPTPDNFTYKIVRGTWPVIGMPFREQISLTKSVAQDKPDIYCPFFVQHCPN